MSTQKEEHHSRNVSSAHPQCTRHRPRQEGSEGRRRRKGIHTMGEKINAICLSHHAFPKYISAVLSPRHKLYWGTLSYCPPGVPLLSLSLSAPLNRTSLQPSNSLYQCFPFLMQGFKKKKLKKKRSAVLINVSCFSAPPAQGIIHAQGPWEVRGGVVVVVVGVLIGIQRNGHRPGQPTSGSSKRLLLSLRGGKNRLLHQRLIFMSWSGLF